MTSVTLSSNTTGPSSHGGSPSSPTRADQLENSTASSSDFQSVSRTAKRCYSLPLTSSSESSKKRRKQSTPIRIYNSEPESIGGDTTGSISAQSYLDEIENKRFASESPLDHHTNVLQCHLCQLIFDTSEELQNHIACRHSQHLIHHHNDDDDHQIEFKRELYDDIIDRDGNNIQQSETSINNIDESPLCLSLHRPDINPWTGELTNREWGHQNLHGMSLNSTSSSSVNPVFMAMSQYGGGSSQPENNIPSSINKPIRIFNLDAYCGLCNKEFCNKYFLKTHKANKHGIYSDNSTSDQQLPTIITSSANMMLPSTFSTNMSLKLPSSSSVVPISLETKNLTNILNPYSVVFPCTIPNNNNNNINNNNNNSTNNGILPTKGNLPIFPENEVNDNNRISISTSNGPSTSTSESDKLIAEDHQSSGAGEIICSSPIIINNMHNNTEPTSSSSVIKNNESEENLNYFDGANNKLSPADDRQHHYQHQYNRELDLSNRLKRRGVMNPKAFCEICNKEYCNKYFLRTHKVKRHGIYIADDNKDQKFDMINNQSNQSWNSTVQTSPLNLIITESSSSSLNDRNKTSSPNEISCELCEIKFQNHSLAQLHAYTVHGKTIPKENNDNLDSSSSYFGPNNNTATTTSEESKKSLDLCKISESEKSLNPEAISQDLQKLQTMILQLNDLDVTTKLSSTCNSCNKEFENRFYLHAHMVTEHGLLLDDITDFEKIGGSENSINNNTLCDLCGKDFQNGDEMKKHINEVHTNIPSLNVEMKEKSPNIDNLINSEKLSVKMFPSNNNNNNNNNNNSSSALPERILSVNIIPTSSYCEICNKELCNKYFMKTHMQRMHGIEIEHGAQIGGVTCDVCNKELCSKYFLRVHKNNTHGINEYGASLLLPPRKSDGETSSTSVQQHHQHQPRISTPESEGASLKPADLADISQRYFTHFTEVCPICSRRFRSSKWLKAHLVNDHGQAGIEKWTEIEHQLQQHTIMNQTLIAKQPSNNKSTIKLEQSSPKMPNGNQSDLLLSSTKNPSSGGTPSSSTSSSSNILNNVFGCTSADDLNNSKSYQCSYCPFTSHLLPLLFIHEKTHSINDHVPLKCPVCPQSFLEKELFQRHMYSQHPILPSSSSSSLHPLFNINGGHHTEATNEEDHFESSLPLQIKIEEESSESTTKPPPPPPPPPPAPPSHPSKLVSSNNQGTTKSTIPKINLTELPIEVSQSLQNAAKKAQLPTTYALPHLNNIENNAQHDENSTDTINDGYVMQAFFLEDSTSSERRVVPSLVFLPMLQKQLNPITISFTLTPA